MGQENILKLNNSTVAVFGVGGVGGFVCEALARSGIGHFLLVDNDTVSLTNINRQIIATHSSIGKQKTEVMKERILDINPNAVIEIRNCFFLPENSDTFEFSSFNYVVDAVDTVSAKIEIIMKAKENNIPVISSMGAGNKMDPTQFKVSDIYKTDTDPLARVMRREMKKRGVKKLKVVYSTETPCELHLPPENEIEYKGKGPAPGSSAWVPSVAGLIIAGEVIKDLCRGKK